MSKTFRNGRHLRNSGCPMCGMTAESGAKIRVSPIYVRGVPNNIPINPVSSNGASENVRSCSLYGYYHVTDTGEVWYEIPFTDVCVVLEAKYIEDNTPRVLPFPEEPFSIEA